MSEDGEGHFDPYVYRCRVDRIIDGDTFEVTFDLGFDINFEQLVRLHGVDTREIHFVAEDTEEYRRGMRHKEFVEEWFAEEGADDAEWPLVSYTVDDTRGKYGRFLADFAPRDEPTALLSDALLEEFDDVEQY